MDEKTKLLYKKEDMRGSIQFLFFFILFILTWGCGEKKQKTNQEQKHPLLKDLFTKDTGKNQEFTDSLAIEAFLQENTSFQKYENKLLKFYRRRNYALAWSKNKNFLPQVSMFINLVRNVEDKGLSTEQFNPGMLDSLYSLASTGRKSSLENTSLRKRLDLYLSASYFKYGRSIWKGSIHPQSQLKWYIDRKKIKYGKTLDSILDSQNGNPFKEYMPLHPEYKKLLSVLDVYRKIEKKGGWPTIPAKKSLQKGDSSQAVLLLRKRLYISGDLKKFNTNPVFDETLAEAVKQYQKRNGLEDDGVAGINTIEHLNIPVKDRITQILANLERWRWVPENIGKTYIMVNIPDFSLQVFEEEAPVMKMKVIVGKKIHTTPIFNDTLRYIVLNPYWNVPKSIAINEIWPDLKEDSGALQNQNMEVFEGNNTQHPLDPYTINWDTLSEDNFPYKFRQKPGKDNALGQIKFLFPNAFSIYLHGTPAKHLFDKNQRDFSHGCIRISEPLKLAEYVLKDDTIWTDVKIKQTLGGENTWIKLSKQEKLPIYILYFTVWVDENGVIQFRDDIYKHDKELEQLLFEADTR